MGDGLREKCDMYRRQLGGTNAALARARQEIKELKAANDKLADANGYLCAKVNELSDERARLRALAYKLIAELRVIEQHEPGTVFCPEFYWELAEGAGLEVPR